MWEVVARLHVGNRSWIAPISEGKSIRGCVCAGGGFPMTFEVRRYYPKHRREPFT